MTILTSVGPNALISTPTSAIRAENSAAFPFLRKCDTAYVVVEAGLSTQKDVLHSLKLLREQVSKLTGLIFNH